MGWMSFVANVIGSLAWPVIVLLLVCIIWFSVPKETRVELVERLREAGPGGVKLDQQLNRANGEITQASAALIHDVTIAPLPASAAASGSATVTVTATGTAEADEPRTADPDEPPEMDNRTFYETQRLIAAAAKWGWIRAGRDSAEFPYPMVAWDKDGAKIVGTRMVNPGDSLLFAAGSYIDPNTGKPNTSTRSMTVFEVDPIRESSR